VLRHPQETRPPGPACGTDRCHAGDQVPRPPDHGSHLGLVDTRLRGIGAVPDGIAVAGRGSRLLSVRTGTGRRFGKIIVFRLPGGPPPHLAGTPARQACHGFPNKERHRFESGIGRFRPPHDIIANDDAIADVGHANDGDAPRRRALCDQGIGGRHGRLRARREITDLDGKRGIFGRELRGGVAVAAPRAGLGSAGARLVSSPIRHGGGKRRRAISKIIVRAAKRGGRGDSRRAPHRIRGKARRSIGGGQTDECIHGRRNTPPTVRPARARRNEMNDFKGCDANLI
jgi:hypothetical protein